MTSVNVYLLSGYSELRKAIKNRSRLLYLKHCKIGFKFSDISYKFYVSEIKQLLIIINLVYYFLLVVSESTYLQFKHVTRSGSKESIVNGSTSIGNFMHVKFEFV